MIARLQELLWTVVSSNPVLERLVTASIDVVLVTALVALIVMIARIRSRRVIALLWLVALIKPIASLAFGPAAPIVPIHHTAAPRATETAVAPEAASAYAYEIVATDRPDGAVERNVEERAVVPPAGGTLERGGGSLGASVAALWLAGVLVMVGAGAVDRLRLRRVIAAASPAGADVAARVRRIASGLRAGRVPQARMTSELESPALAGTLRPVILLPAWIVTPGHEERLDWALRHELAHWNARDHLANLACEAARALFFFHPVVWWASRRWKEAMEMACDEAVVTCRRDVKRYAEQLYQILAHVDERRRLALSTSLFATRTQIGRRIETLLRTRRPLARPGVAAIVLVCAFAATAFAVGTTVVPRAPRTPRAPIAPVIAGGDTEVYVVGESGTASYDDVNVNVSDDDRELRLRAEFIEFDRATGRIVHLGVGGFLRVWEKDGDTERRLRVTAGDDGELNYHYRVNGHGADFDDDARQWFAGVLRQHLTRVRNFANLVKLPTLPSVPGVSAVELPALPEVPTIAPMPMVMPMLRMRSALRPLLRMRALHRFELPEIPAVPDLPETPVPAPAPKPRPEGERI